MKNVVKEHRGPKAATWGIASDYNAHHWIDSNGQAQGYDDHTVIFRFKSEENARAAVLDHVGYLVQKITGQWVPV